MEVGSSGISAMLAVPFLVLMMLIWLMAMDLHGESDLLMLPVLVDLPANEMGVAVCREEAE